MCNGLVSLQPRANQNYSHTLSIKQMAAVPYGHSSQASHTQASHISKSCRRNSSISLALKSGLLTAASSLSLCVVCERHISWPCWRWNNLIVTPPRTKSALNHLCGFSKLIVFKCSLSLFNASFLTPSWSDRRSFFCDRESDCRSFERKSITAGNSSVLSGSVA